MGLFFVNVDTSVSTGMILFELGLFYLNWDESI